MNQPFQLRVLTLNVWALQGAADRRQRLRDSIATLRPDLVALQEVARDDRDQLADLLAGTELHGVHQVDLLDPNTLAQRAGTALASRWQPTKIEAADLAPAGEPSDYRCALAATIPLPIGLDLLFISAKPSWRLDAEAERVAQARTIAELDTKLRCPVPTIIAGDFDATPDADSLRYLTGRAAVDGHSVHYHDAWAVAGDGGPGFTWTGDNPLAAPVIDALVGQLPHARRIDYILVGSRHAHPDVAARVRRCEVVVTDPPASDHYGVLAHIEVARLR